MVRQFLPAVFGLTFLLSPSAAEATSLPSTIDPLRQEQFSTPEIEIDPRQGAAPTGTQENLAIPPEAEELKLDITQILLSGNTVFTAADLFADEVQGKQPTSLADLYRLANRITQYYRSRGYVFANTTIPAQRIQNGIIRLNISEGYVDTVSVDEPEQLTASMRMILMRMQNSRAFNIYDLERNLLLINDMSSLSRYAVFGPSTKGIAGSFDIKLVAEENQPFSLFQNFDNRGGSYLGPQQSSSVMLWKDSFLRQDSTYFSLNTSLPLREKKQLGLGYSRFINSYGLSLGTNITLSDTHPGQELRLLEVQSVARKIDFDLRYPIIRQRAENLFVGLKFAHSFSRSSILSALNYKDEFNSLELYAQWQKADRWLGVTSLSSRLAFGLPFMGGSQTGDADLSREDAQLDFTTITLEASRNQYFGQNWSLLAKVSAQYSPEPLLSSLEIGFGGAEIGRGFLPSEITGDRGITSSFELSYMGLREVFPSYAPVIYGFSDFGVLWNIDNSMLLNERQSGASAGIGVKWQIGDYLDMEVEIAHPILKPTTSTINHGLQLFWGADVRF